jgi:hypothetical protein
LPGCTAPHFCGKLPEKPESKPIENETMKTTDITRALRNSATPAARLAAWQDMPLWKRRKSLAEYYNKNATLAARRRSLIAGIGPELSAPDAEKPLLWISGTKDPALADWTAGRDFLDHRGWFADDYQDETLETYAVTLKAFPRLMFYAVKSDGGLRVELSDWEAVDFSECESEYQADEARRECAKEIICSNDSSTDYEAKESQEYYRKDGAEFDIAENKATLKTLRGEIRALCHELKTLCQSSMSDLYPVAAKAVRDSLKTLLRERRELMERNHELAASL